MISFIRDYLEILSDASVATANSFELLQITVKFFVNSFGRALGYFLTFGWVRDVLYLPIVLPKWHEAILSEHFFSEEININLFQALAHSPQIGLISLFGLGFLNSFICCLPFSTVHFLSLRRLFVQGLTAGVASISGMIFGQCLFIALVIFGARSILIPWFNLDPLNYFLGLGLLFMVIYDMASEKRIRPVELSEQNVLIKIFLISFVLSWTEQSYLGQYFANLHFSNESSLLTLNGIGSFSDHFGYILGLFFGHFFFSFIFLGLSLFVRKSLLTISGLPYSIWVKQINFIFLTFILGCNLSSIPYYGLDYLITKPLGFISQDKTFDMSFLSGKNLKDPSRLLTSVDAVFPLTIDTNISHYDRDNYGDQTGFFKRNFEELNYQGEYAWVVRRDRKPDLYSSGEPTKTKIRNLFQTDETTGTNQPNTSVEQTTQLPAKATIPEKNQNTFFFDSTIQSADRQKLKKRFDEMYEETREKDTYLIGESFNSFPLLESPQSPSEIALKQKYYANGVYKTLLNTEIDTFLNRQPKNYLLTPDEENQLFQKRSLLSQYYDTIRAYEKLPYQLEFKDLFQGSKSFIDRPYNHQFKGNLHITKRLFAVTLDEKENPTQKSVLKYDIPLFRETEKNYNQLIHEELKTQSIINKPFLEFSDGRPFYVGWDNDTRQMVLTKRLSTNSPMFMLNQPTNFTTQNYKHLLQSVSPKEFDKASSTQMKFIRWPIQEPALKELKSKPNNRVITLFEPLTNPDMQSMVALTSSSGNETKTQSDASLPINMKYLGKISDYLLPPNHGGFIWPGNGM